MERSESVTKLVPALIAAQKSYKPLVKNKTNPHFGSKYADLADVIEATQESLNNNGLAIVQGIDFVENQTVVHTTLFHESGEFVSQSLRIPGAQANAQHVISASTYARRGQWVAISGIAADDDIDGNTADQNKNPSPKPQPKVNQKPATATNAPRPGENKNSQIAIAEIINQVQKEALSPADTKTSQIEKPTSVLIGQYPENGHVNLPDAPYTKDEYMKIVAPRVKGYYEKADRESILTFIKERTPAGKKTEELTRVVWEAIFQQLDEKFRNLEKTQ